MKNLKNLDIQYCERVTDYTPIAGCSSLEQIHLQCDYNPDALRDASFLANLPRLWDIGLYSCNLNDLDFLEGKPDNGRLCLGFAGDIRDYSGLAFVKHYDWLHLNPRRVDGSRFGDLSAVLPYLEGAEVKNLHLHDCGGIDLSLLPKVTESLEIWYGDLTDLSTLPDWGIKRLMLYDCQYLTSLDGIQSLPAYTQPGSLTLTVAGCPRLRDWSAIENASLSGLELQGVYSLPVFDGIGFGSLRLESIEELSDLSILSALSDGHSYNSIALVGLDAISDLSPLRRLQIKHLEIPPQVADQAEELVEAGIVGDYEVAYPDGSWQPFDGAMELLSLDELETLPAALLRRVERLGIAGDALFDPGCDRGSGQAQRTHRPAGAVSLRPADPKPGRHSGVLLAGGVFRQGLHRAERRLRALRPAGAALGGSQMHAGGFHPGRAEPAGAAVSGCLQHTCLRPDASGGLRPQRRLRG